MLLRLINGTGERKWLENVDWTHLVLASGEPVPSFTKRGLKPSHRCTLLARCCCLTRVIRWEDNPQMIFIINHWHQPRANHPFVKVTEILNKFSRQLLLLLFWKSYTSLPSWTKVPLSLMSNCLRVTERSLRCLGSSNLQNRWRRNFFPDRNGHFAVARGDRGQQVVQPSPSGCKSAYQHLILALPQLCTKAHKHNENNTWRLIDCR